MNTKASFGLGWVAYTAAFGVGGAVGWRRYYYAPGGRRDREKAAERAEAVREREEAEFEERVRAERTRHSQDDGGGDGTPASPLQTGRATDTAS
jgi:hypothetical protein